jgi:glycosidase
VGARRAVLVGFFAFAACADVAPAAYDARPLAPLPTRSDAGTDDTAPASDASMTEDAGAVAPLPVTADTWTSQVLYFVMPDRFADGDPSNDSAVAGCFDPTDPKKIHGGDLAGLRARIPYLKDLGVTALWITPQYLQSTDRCGYHGYWADFVDPDDGALAPNEGPASDLTSLVSDLHAAGMRLVLDMVVNHSGTHARVVSQHPEWFHDASTCAALGDPAVYCPLNAGLPDFAQERPDVAAFLSTTSARWATRSGIDGVRMDTVKNVLPAFWAGSWFPAMRAASPSLFTLGEVFDESGAAALAPYLDDGFDSLFDYPRYAALASTFAAGGSVDAVADQVNQAIATYGLARATRMTSFLDNHDNPRFTSRVPAGTNDADALARFRLALGAVFTLPGVPQLMWGDEIAMRGGPDPDNRRDMPAWAWSASSRAGAHAGDAVGDGQATYAFVQSLIAARLAHTALQRGSYAEQWRQNGAPTNVLGFFRGEGADLAIVAINAGAAATVSLPIATSKTVPPEGKAALPDGTVLHELLGAGAPASATVAGGVLTLALPTATMGIYVAK